MRIRYLEPISRLLISCLLLLTLGGWVVASIQLPVPRRVVTVALMGQSNGQGQGDSALSEDVPDSLAREWLFDGATGLGRFRTGLADPVSRNQDTFFIRAHTGSLVPALAARYVGRTGRAVAVTQLCYSGSALRQRPGSSALRTMNWSDPMGAYTYGAGLTQRNYGVLRAQLKAQVQAMLAALGKGDSLDWLVMTIGETDGVYLDESAPWLAEFPDSMQVPGTYDAAHGYPGGYPNPTHRPDTYSAYADFLNWVGRQWPRARVCLNQTGRAFAQSAQYPQSQVGSHHVNGYPRMWAIQEQLVRKFGGLVVMGCAEPKNFGPLGFMKPDGIHYTQAGLNLVGTADAEVMAAADGF